MNKQQLYATIRFIQCDSDVSFHTFSWNSLNQPQARFTQCPAASSPTFTTSCPRNRKVNVAHLREKLFLYLQHLWHLMQKVFFFPPPTPITNTPTLQTPTRCPIIQLNSETNDQELDQTPLVKGSVPHTSPPLQMPVVNLDLHTFGQLAINKGSPRPHAWISYFARLLHRIQENSLRVYYKTQDSGTA